MVGSSATQRLLAGTTLPAMRGLRRVPVCKASCDLALDVSREVPDEVAVAIVHDGSTYGVMMATPADLEDFGLGLSFTEGLIETMGDVLATDVVTSDRGCELRMWLAAGLAATLLRRRRLLFGPSGCGLCGVESLEQAAQAVRRPLADIDGLTLSDIFNAMVALEQAQSLGRRTHAVHAAGLWRPGTGLAVVREDVGRHNAVDKVAGALLRSGLSASGVLLLTSRVSIELVQKAAAIGVPMIAAVSAPTQSAIALAEAAGITLVAVVRHDSLEVFTHRRRIVDLVPA